MLLLFFSIFFCIKFNSQLKTDIEKKNISIDDIKNILFEELNENKEKLRNIIQEKKIFYSKFRDDYKKRTDIFKYFPNSTIEKTIKSRNEIMNNETIIDNFIQCLNKINKIFLSFDKHFLFFHSEFYKIICTRDFKLKAKDLEFNIFSESSFKNPYILKVYLNIYLISTIEMIFTDRLGKDFSGNIKKLYELITKNTKKKIIPGKKTLIYTINEDSFFILFK